MGGGEKCYSTHLIDGEGEFNSNGLEEFAKKVNLAKCGKEYTVVSIMGPQSSGKSTLLNHLFGTDFKTMDADIDRSQTTVGIWLAKCPDIKPCTLVLDMEGNDGKERGEDHSFEIKIALFALAVSDILLINMWCHDIGRENAANKPLLRTVFQAMMRLFKPRQSTLLFVIRDKSKTPFTRLEQLLKKDTEEIWKSITKPQPHKETPISEFFNIEVVGLPSYEHQEEKFKQEVAELKTRFAYPKIQCRPLVPSRSFALSTKEIWNIVKEDKALDIPSHTVMVSKVRCEQIAKEELDWFIANEEWSQLKKAIKAPPVPYFGEKLTSMINTCLSEYHKEAEYYDETVRFAQEEILKQNLLQEIKPFYDSLLENLSFEALTIFKDNFNKAMKGGERFCKAIDCSEILMKFDSDCADATIQQANWTSYEAKNWLMFEIAAHVDSIRTIKQNELTIQFKEKLKNELLESLGAIMRMPGRDTWQSIRNLLRQKTELASSEFSFALDDLGTNKTTKDVMLAMLKSYGREVVETRARKESEEALFLMQNRFSNLLFNDPNTRMPRAWSGDEDVEALVRSARSECITMLAALVAIRLEEDKRDNIEETLSHALFADGTPSNGGSIVSSSTWEGVASSNTLITPSGCVSVWMLFLDTTGIFINSVKQIIEAKKNSPKGEPTVIYQRPHESTFEKVVQTAIEMAAIALASRMCRF